MLPLAFPPPVHRTLPCTVLIAQRMIAGTTGLKPDVLRQAIYWINGKGLFVDMPSVALAEQVVCASQGEGPVCTCVCTCVYLCVPVWASCPACPSRVVSHFLSPSNCPVWLPGVAFSTMN
jgi:hypothetical protein